jgi:hypothetical protein
VGFSPFPDTLYDVNIYVGNVLKASKTEIKSFSSAEFDIIFNDYNTTYTVNAKITPTLDSSVTSVTLTGNYTTISKPSGGGDSGGGDSGDNESGGGGSGGNEDDSETSKIYICITKDGGKTFKWYPAKSYIYFNGWKEVKATYVYEDEEWKQCN